MAPTIARGGALLGLGLLFLTMTPGTLCDSGTAWTKRSKHTAAKGSENGRPSSRWTRKTVKATGHVQEEHEMRNPSSSQAMTRKSCNQKVTQLEGGSASITSHGEVVNPPSSLVTTSANQSGSEDVVAIPGQGICSESQSWRKDSSWLNGHPTLSQEECEALARDGGHEMEGDPSSSGPMMENHWARKSMEKGCTQLGRESVMITSNGDAAYLPSSLVTTSAIKSNVGTIHSPPLNQAVARVHTVDSEADMESVSEDGEVDGNSEDDECVVLLTRSQAEAARVAVSAVAYEVGSYSEVHNGLDIAKRSSRLAWQSGNPVIVQADYWHKPECTECGPHKRR